MFLFVLPSDSWRHEKRRVESSFMRSVSSRQHSSHSRAGAQPRLKSLGGPRFGSQHRGLAPRARPKVGLGVGCGAGGGRASRCEGSGYHPRKIFKNSDAESCILVTNYCEISCFMKTTAKKLGAIHCWSPTKLGNQSPHVPTVVAPMFKSFGHNFSVKVLNSFCLSDCNARAKLFDFDE